MAGPAVALTEAVLPGDGAHAGLHNGVNDQVNFLTDHLAGRAVDPDLAAVDALAAAGVLPPVPRQRVLPRHTIVEAFQAGHAWFVAGTGATSVDDTVDYVMGSRSVAVTSDGAAHNASLSKAGYTLNMTGKGFIVWVKVDDQSKLASLVLDAGNTALTAKFRAQLAVANAVQPNVEALKSGEWVPLMVPWSALNATKVGVPDRTNIQALSVGFIDAGGGAVTVHVGGIASYTEPTAYPKGVLSLEFDDAYSASWNTALPKMSALGMRGSLFPVVDQLDTAGKLTTAQLLLMHRVYGWEVGAHAYATNRHVNLSTLTADQIEADFRQLKAWMHANAIDGGSFAYPVGPFTAAHEALARKHWSSGRTGGARYLSPRSSTPHRFGAFGLNSAVTLATAKTWIDNLVAGGGWGRIVIHDLVGAGAGATSWLIADFNALMDYIAASGIVVAPPSEAFGKGVESDLDLTLTSTQAYVDCRATPYALSGGTWNWATSYGFGSLGNTTTVHTAVWVAALQPGTYRLDAGYAKASTAGIMDFDYSLDGGVTWISIAAGVDGYAAGATGAQVSATGIIINSAVLVQLRCKATGTKNASASNYYMSPAFFQFQRTA